MPIIAQKTMSQLPLLDPVSSHSGLLLFFRYSYYQRHKTYSRNRDDDDDEEKNVIFSNEISKTAMINTMSMFNSVLKAIVNLSTACTLARTFRRLQGMLFTHIYQSQPGHI